MRIYWIIFSFYFYKGILTNSYVYDYMFLFSKIELLLYTHQLMQTVLIDLLIET